ncbi:MAG TPA: nuclear transport factor 2 family protein [Solirubrobacteraceae bacterium]|nr:nuclear transport factor 2 family protein [Solirubrobacteraceae bacterium]
MSRQNVEIVRQILEIQPFDLGRASELLDTDIEWFPAAQSLLAADSYRGHEGVRRFWADLLSVWDEYLVEPEEFMDLGDQVVVITRIRARSPSGVKIEETWSGLFDMRDGRIVRFRGFTDRDGALEAAGLRG